MSHATYAQFNTFSRTAHALNPSFQSPGDYPGDCGLLDSSNQLSYDYGYPSQYPNYRIGFAPPIEEGPAYEMYSTGQGAGPGQQSPGTGLEEYGGSTHFSVSSPPSDYSQKHTQRMQTHVWVFTLLQQDYCTQRLHWHLKIINPLIYVCYKKIVQIASSVWHMFVLFFFSDPLN